MPTVAFTTHLRQVLPSAPQPVIADTLRTALDRAMAAHPQGRGYVLDEQGRVRKHIAVFIDGQLLRDRAALDVAIGPDSEIHVMQALSGG